MKKVNGIKSITFEKKRCAIQFMTQVFKNSLWFIVEISCISLNKKSIKHTINY